MPSYNRSMNKVGAGLRIVLYGNFVVPYCSEVQYANTLEDMGHEVVRLQETTVTTETVLKESLKADMLVWVHSHGFVNQGNLNMGEVLEMLKNAGKPTVAYHLDLYMGLERWKEYEHSDYFKVQHFFTVDKLMADWLNENTETKGHFLLAGCYEAESYPHPDYDPENFEQDVIFVGSRGYHHEWPFRPQLIDWLRATYGKRFLHIGGDGDTGTVRGDSLNRIYAKSKIAIGDTLNIGFNYPYYSSDRLFESICRYGFTIYPRIHGIDSILKDSVEVVYYNHGDFTDLKEKIDYYLTHDDEREKIREAGHKRGKREHTYKSRWQTILQEVRCVNPEHLEQTTHYDNIINKGKSNAAYINSLKTHCNYGHDLTNSYIQKTKYGTTRRCKECHKRRMSAYKTKRELTK